jgi:hypothetical protein
MYSVVRDINFPRDNEACRLLAVDEASRAKECAAPSQLSSLSNRLRFITHQAKRILLIDVSNCSAAEVEKIFRAVPELVTTHLRGSVRLICFRKNRSHAKRLRRQVEVTTEGRASGWCVAAHYGSLGLNKRHSIQRSVRSS